MLARLLLTRLLPGLLAISCAFVAARAEPPAATPSAAHGGSPPAPSPAVSRASAAAPDAPAPATPPSALSYGTVTSQVRKGETTQLDLVQLFGAPNISSYDSRGTETWLYERTVAQTDVRATAESSEGAARLGLFFRFGGIGGGAARTSSSAGSTTTTSVRSITVIVKFNDDKIVSDYSVRASYF